MTDQKAHYAWCAGFFDGEGSTGFHSRVNKSNGYTYNNVIITIAQVHKEPLVRFRRFIGDLGGINGPYGPYGKNKQPYYQYYISGKAARTALRRMWPFLSKIKRMQARPCLIAFAQWLKIPDLKKGPQKCS